MERKAQATNQVIDVSVWPPDDDFSPYPEGARAKTAYICPESVEYSFLIPNHRYLFKQSNPRYPAQFWVEIIAYLVGCYTNLPVPPAFVSFDSVKNICGALIEWFYGYPEEEFESRYTMGGDFMTRLIPSYDRDKGTQHNFRSIETLARAFTKEEILSKDYVSYWSKVFIFDALIGNTDRHQDNWGLVWYNTDMDNVQAKFSPAFDNGTAMGHEILENNFHKFKDISYMERYVAKGAHHMKWYDKKHLNFQEFILNFLDRFPESREVMLETLNFDLNSLVENILGLTDFNVNIPISKARALFVIDLLRYRHERLFELVKV